VTCALVLAIGLSPQYTIIAAALVAAGIFRPVRAWLGTNVEQRLAPTTYQARRAIADLSNDLPLNSHLDALCDRLVLAIQRGWSPEAAVLWVRSSPSLSAQVVARVLPTIGAAGLGATPTGPPTLELQVRRSTVGDGQTATTPQLVIAADDPIRVVMPVAVGAVPVAQLPARSPAASALKAVDALLALPLMAEGDLLAVCALGPRTAGTAYTADECELLDELARLAAPTLRVALVTHEQDTASRTREQAEQEMRTARRIQQTLLPKEVPALDGWRIDVYYEPAREVGGDFYDFLRFADGRLGIVLGDVTDKGVPAALVMATTRSMLRAAAQETTPPGAVLARVNDLLCADLPPSMFVTCFYGILDPMKGTMRFANAGQDLPYLRRADACVSEVYATGMPLGLMPDMTYEEGEVALHDGDSILFYSDGLVEAHDPRRQMFGFHRLMALLGREAPADGQIATLLRELAGFTGVGWEQEDDITLVALRHAYESR
jgi:serine phosphatase RsbU (regulator of sigma subunit)